MNTCCTPLTSETQQLKSNLIAAWLKEEWVSRYPDTPFITAWVNIHCVNDDLIQKLDRSHLFVGYRFSGYQSIPCDFIHQIESLNHESALTTRLGAFRYRFERADGHAVEVLVASTHYDEQGDHVTAVAAVPADFTAAWTAFSNEMTRLAYKREPDNRVMIIGGRHDSFVPEVEWDEIVLPDTLKAEIRHDVASFFRKGVEVYRNLNLKPFRKLMFAGVPGTGKTMLCNALAKWALDEGYMVIYISSAVIMRGEQLEGSFSKIQYALDIAAHSQYPTIIIVEELDAYLHEQQKALILNVLDGSESRMNPLGTLLIATTNYPEAIDERVLKRPGRLDRIFIIPQTRTPEDAGTMLRRYLGSMWQPAHESIVPRLVGYPGAFIREVAIYALTQVAYDDLTELSPHLLVESFERLKAQIDARDNLLKERHQPEAVANGAHE